VKSVGALSLCRFHFGFISGNGVWLTYSSIVLFTTTIVTLSLNLLRYVSSGTFAHRTQAVGSSRDDAEVAGVFVVEPHTRSTFYSQVLIFTRGATVSNMASSTSQTPGNQYGTQSMSAQPTPKPKRSLSTMVRRRKHRD